MASDIAGWVLFAALLVLVVSASAWLLTEVWDFWTRRRRT